jgi:hypothetical protein
VILGRTLTTALPALLKDAMDDPQVTVASVCSPTNVAASSGATMGRRPHHCDRSRLSLRPYPNHIARITWLMNPAGTWDLSISTPIGKIKAVVGLHEKAGRLPSSKVTGQRRAGPSPGAE